MGPNVGVFITVIHCLRYTWGGADWTLSDVMQ